MYRATRLFVLIVAVAVTLTACSDGNKKSATPTTAVTVTTTTTTAPTNPVTIQPPQPSDFTIIGPAGYTVKCSQETQLAETTGDTAEISDPTYSYTFEFINTGVVDEVNRLVGSKYAAGRIGELHAGEDVKWFFRGQVYEVIQRLNPSIDFTDVNLGNVSYHTPKFCQLYLLKPATPTTISGSASNSSRTNTTVGVNN